MDKKPPVRKTVAIPHPTYDRLVEIRFSHKIASEQEVMLAAIEAGLPVLERQAKRRAVKGVE